MNMTSPLPTTYSRVVCVKQTFDFAQGTVVERDASMADLEAQLAANPTLVLIQARILGLNASDVNYIKGSYDPKAKPPYTAGFEALGKVVRVGAKVTAVKVGDCVGTMSFGAFSEFIVLPERLVFPIPEIRPEYLGLMVNGLTAYLALHKTTPRGVEPGMKVLVTGAVGATGQIAVQVAKAAGCHVIGTCGNEDKAVQLRALGADRAINYRTEDVGKVLRSEYRRGVDLVFEGIGGKMFEQALASLSPRGNLIVIGAASTYHAEGRIDELWQDKVPTYLLLHKSIGVVGFFLNHYAKDIPEAWTWLVKTFAKGKLQVAVDPTPFFGLDQVKDAVAYMQTGKNIGKIVVDLRKGNSKL
ncbi:hypothetical protein H9P43_001497 [Blastocladiella emersonii ATCC 22665]|nr:hypothetical protein H9P43_001497 [Blastocladiella emersonii ATCC 22665]